MKITIEHKGTKIIIEETGEDNKLASMKYSDENTYIQETIRVICDEVIKLQSNHNQNEKI